VLVTPGQYRLCFRVFRGPNPGLTDSLVQTKSDMNTQQAEKPDYMSAFRGSFTSALKWPNLDALWQAVRDQHSDDWYIYAIGHEPPESPVSQSKLAEFITEIDQLLRKEHDHDYCGIVYADDLKQPAFIKIYDPNNLGVSCGYSDNPPLPGWVLSKLQPVDVPANQVVPGNRRSWWQRLFGSE